MRCERERARAKRGAREPRRACERTVCVSVCVVSVAICVSVHVAEAASNPVCVTTYPLLPPTHPTLHLSATNTLISFLCWTSVICVFLFLIRRREETSRHHVQVAQTGEHLPECRGGLYCRRAGKGRSLMSPPCRKGRALLPTSAAALKSDCIRK